MTRSGTETILLVDDSGALQNRLGPPLAARGFETTVVESASECLDFIEEQEVTAIVSVYDLSDLDGLQLLRSVRVTQPTLPFILAPKNGSESLASDAIAAGVNHYVPIAEGSDTLVNRLEKSIQEAMPWVDEESEQRYRHLIEMAPVPINLFDATGESIWCNQAVLELLDLENRDELIGQSIFEYIHPDDHELAAQEIEAVIEGKESVGPTQMRLRSSTGETRHIYVSTAIGRFLGDDIGQAVILDVTDLRETRRELQDQREFIETALDSLDDLFYVIDAEGNLILWNDAVPEKTGYNEESISDMEVDEFFVEEDRSAIWNSIRTVLETGSDTIQAGVVTADGQRDPYEFRCRLLQTGQSRDDRKIVGIARDISVQKERERQLVVLERWLRHNIRNDLNVIHGHARLIQDDDTDRKEHASTIERTTARLLKQSDHERKMVELLSDPSEQTQLDLSSLVQEVVVEHREEYPAAEIEISRADSIEARVIPELQYAIGEIIENAITHNDAEIPSVKIEVFGDGKDGIIRITDNGPGIPDIEQADLFIDNEVDQIVHSSGLGLLTAYWAVRSSNGSIEIAENSPRGTVVTISVPAST